MSAALTENERVLIAGAGPVGLLCAYTLARQNIPVSVFEAEGKLLDDPRAATTHPATLELLDRVGLASKVEKMGLVAVTFEFRDRPTDELVATFDHTLLQHDTAFPYVVQCEQFKLSKTILALLQDLSCCDLRFSHVVTSARQTHDGVVLRVATPGGAKEFTGRYLIGADGGRSVIRKSMDIPFEGFTYPERFLVLTTPFDFKAQRGYAYRTYMADPDEWCNCFKVPGEGPPGLWRTVFPTKPEQTDEQVLSDTSVHARLQKFFPKKGDYEIVHRNLYTIHQRVAGSFRKGRVFLAGDSAHVNSSIGGMGLNSGIHDAMNLAEKLVRVYHGERGLEEMDAYDRERRTAAVEYVQRDTIANKRRLECSDPVLRKKYLDELRAIAADPVKARQFMMRTSMLESLRVTERRDASP